MAEAVDPIEVEAGTLNRRSSRLSTRAEWFDWLVLAATVVLAVMSVWIGSSIVRGIWDYIVVGLLWVVVGAARTVTVFLRTTDLLARVAMAVLIVGALGIAFLAGPITVLILWTPLDWVVAGVLVIVPFALFLVRQCPIRVVWFVAPAIVLAAAATVLSGVAASARFAAAEPELTRYVQGLDQGAELPGYEQPATVGGVPVFEVIREDGQTLLVTGFIGILGDDPAGLAFVPEGSPVGVHWEHIRGPWYRWIPLHYAPE